MGTHWKCMFLLFLCSGCAPGIPIQALRVVQVESYTQAYELNRKDLRNAFEIMLGPCNMEVLYGLDPESNVLQGYLNDLQNRFPKKGCEQREPKRPNVSGGALARMLTQNDEEEIPDKIMVRGALTVEVIPNGIRPSEFIITGWGRYFVYVTNSSEMLASAQFNIEVDKVHSVAELENAGLMLRIPVRQWLAREFARGGVQYIAESRLLVRLHFRSPRRGVYEIDYGARHEVELDVDQRMARSGLQVGQMHIGSLQFDAPANPEGVPRKLLDVRILDSPSLIQGDYLELDGLHWRTDPNAEGRH